MFEVLENCQQPFFGVSRIETSSAMLFDVDLQRVVKQERRV